MLSRKYDSSFELSLLVSALEESSDEQYSKAPGEKEASLSQLSDC